jgi:cobalt-zinc-cadmium efflux system protein
MTSGAAEHEHGEHEPREGGRTKTELLFAVCLTAVVLVVEVAGGVWAGSLALLSDAAHVFTDLVSLALSLGALTLAARPVSKEHTFGFHRAEVFAALVNGVLLVAISIALLRAAYLRLLSPPVVRVEGMLVIAAAGLAANGVIAWRLRGHAHGDVNVRGAYLHVLADLAGSVGVVAAGVVMALTRSYLADPIISIGIGLIVFYGSGRLLRDTAHILLEGVPRGVSLDAVAGVVKAVPGVDGIHDLHIWTICSGLLALSVHVTAGERAASERDEIVGAINGELTRRFGISETTIQVEKEPCRTAELIHIVPHQ